MIGERQEYECRNAGCDGERVFEDAPEEWFIAKGLSTPASCPECRAWKKAQEKIGAVELHCSGCGETWPVEAKYRISFHKSEGSWDLHAAEIEAGRKVCGRCERQPWRRERSLQKRWESEYERKPRKDEDRDATGLALERGILGATSIGVPEDIAYYVALANHGHQAKHGTNELEHIMKRGHGLERFFGTEDREVILSELVRFAASDSPDLIQCHDGHRELIKADPSSGLVVMFRPDRKGSWRIRTAYITENLRDHLRRKKAWRPFEDAS